MSANELDELLGEIHDLEKTRTDLSRQIGQRVLDEKGFTHDFQVFLASVAGTLLIEKVADPYVRSVISKIKPISEAETGEKVLVTARNNPVAIGRIAPFVSAEPESRLRFTVEKGIDEGRSLNWEVFAGLSDAFVNGKRTGDRHSPDQRLPGIEGASIARLPTFYDGHRISFVNFSEREVHVGEKAIMGATEDPDVMAFVLEASVSHDG